MHKKYFGTDGIRGEVGQSLVNPEFILKLGWAVGQVLKQKKPITALIGKDTRISGYMIESALQAGLSAAGVNIKLTGPMPTPAIAYLTRSVRADIGIVISASHNAYPDNGIKFFDHAGFKLSDELEAAIEDKIDVPMKTVAPDKLGKAYRMLDADGRYIEFCKSTFPPDLTLKRFKLVIDTANGATYQIAPSIFHELGAHIDVLAKNPNGCNINKASGATDTRALQQRVLEQEADVGIAFDGDGDRLIMVDHTGAMVDGDELLCILAIERFRYTKHCSPSGIVGTIMSNLGLEETLKKHHIPFVRAPVGDRHVLERLQSKQWYLGGESSGHIVDLGLTTTGDGVITALQILRIMHQEDQPLSSLKKIMSKKPQVLINVPVTDAVKLEKHPNIAKAVLKAEEELAGLGRVLLRASGTEPVIRVMVEGHDEDIIHGIARKLASVIQNLLT